MLAFALVLAIAVDPQSLTPEQQTATLQQGVNLFEAGKYDEAIAKYQEVLAANPANATAAYELGTAYAAKSEFAKCRQTLAPLAESASGATKVRAIDILGSCLDSMGEAKLAVETYRRGLAIDPNDAMLNFNLGVTLVAQHQYDEARALLERDLRSRPSHASGQWGLAQVFDRQGFRVPALLAYLRFLSLEPEGKRAVVAAGRVREMLSENVKQSGKNINITIDPNSPKAEGDYSAAEMMLAIASASSALPENKKKSDFEKVQTQVTLALAMLSEAPPAADNFTAEVNLPFFAELGKQELTDAFASIALQSLKLKGADVWASHHPAEVAKAAELLKSQSGALPVRLPN